MPARKRGFDSRTKLQEFVARVAKAVKAPVRKTGNREFESHRVLFDAEMEQEPGSVGS